MMKKRIARDDSSRATGQTDAGKHLYQNHTTRRALRQLARQAERRAHASAQLRTRGKFARLALFLKVFAARGGVR